VAYYQIIRNALTGAGDWMQEGIQFILGGGKDKHRRGVGFVLNA